MHSSVTSRGHKIGYRTDGSGTPLVLLCGFSRWADNWWDVGYVDQLTDQYRVIAIDRLGHGSSDKPHDPAEYPEHLIVADIIAVLDAEGIERAIVWGFSMGSQNAAAVAQLEPDRVAALVCGGSAPLPVLPGRRERVLGWASMIRSDEQMIAWLRAIGSDEEVIVESMAVNDSAALAATVIGVADWAPNAAAITAPSLWYLGSDDGPFSPDDLALATRLGVETQLIEGADHVASYRRVDDVLAVVRPFLDRHRF